MHSVQSREITEFGRAREAHLAGRAAEAIETIMRLALGGINPTVRLWARRFLSDQCNVVVAPDRLPPVGGFSCNSGRGRKNSAKVVSLRSTRRATPSA